MCRLIHRSNKRLLAICQYKVGMKPQEINFLLCIKIETQRRAVRFTYSKKHETSEFIQRLDSLPCQLSHSTKM